MDDVVLCTIVAKNYIPFARVLCRSFLGFHPGARAIVLLADRNEGHVDPEGEPFELVEAEDLGIPDFESFSFKYTILEFCTAVKPFFLEWVFGQRNAAKAFYFDPDILVTRDLDALIGELDRHEILLTPHLTRPYPDDGTPSELEILRTGAYNLGFIGLRSSATTRELLIWWKERCFEGCFIDPERGHFVDQRWIDLVPGLFSGVRVLREPGYNVAYWNLHERRVDWSPEPTVNSEPLRFFHFSGIEPDSLGAISKYQSRFSLSNRPELRPLFLRYEQLLRENGSQDCALWPYAFGYFDDGRPIHALARKLYRSLSPSERRRFGNPFETGGRNSYLRWLSAPADLAAARRERRRLERRSRRRRRRLWLSGLLKGRRPFINNLMFFLQQNDPIIRRRFPDISGRDGALFLHWYLRNSGTWDDFRPADSECGRVVARPRREKTETPTPPQEHKTPGVHIAGYFSAETGVGECARSFVMAAERAGLPYSLDDLESTALPWRVEASRSIDRSNSHRFNLVFVNADQLPNFVKRCRRRYFKGRYTIGFWHWELSGFPDRWRDRFRLLDELWVPSRFCLEAISPKASIPVLWMPGPVEPILGAELTRQHFGLRDDVFVFLFAFDFMSYFERKNPLALIRAFREAFGHVERGGPKLVIKSSNAARFPHEFAQMKEEAEGLSVEFIDRQFSEDEIRNLIRLCDCYASLHRSEGYGVTMAEAMYFGRPVIATGYSGNLDFMNSDNSLLVSHRSIEIEEDVGPYRVGEKWADPDIDEAARHMRFVVGHPGEVRAMAARARRDIRRSLSHESIGERVRARLATLEG